MEGETSRALIKQATQVVDLPEGVKGAEIDAAIAELKNRPALKHIEAGLDGQLSRMVEDSLRPIGAAIDPRLSPDQARTWRKALLLKLSNLPGPLLIKAAREAIHERFNFMNEVEPKIAEIADRLLKQQQVVVMRLERWRAEIERAANPQPALEAPAEPTTQEDVDELNASLAKAGLKTRFRLDEAGEVVMTTPPSEERHSGKE